MPNTDPVTDGCLIVGDGIRVRHGAHAGEPARRGGAGAARNRFDVLVAGLAQVDVHVHEPGGDNLVPHVPNLGAVGRPETGANRGDFPVLNEDVRDLVEAPARVDHAAALQEQGPHHSGPPDRFAASASSGRPPASRYSTAIRTATPLVTWSRITLCGPSATRESISTPRFIGPGCMMSRSFGARSRRSAVTPNTR